MIKRVSRKFASKVLTSSHEAVKRVKSGDTLLFGGFGLVGIPENLIRALADGLTNNHTVLSNEGGTDYFGLGLMIQRKQVKRMISSYIGGNNELQRQFLHGEIEIQFEPQGSLVEKCRAGGAGIPAFYTATGVGTMVELGGEPIRLNKNGATIVASQPKESRIINGRKYLFEQAITGDYSFVKGWKGDTKGNVIFRESARNFNPDIAKAGKVCIVEVEELVPAGQLDPDQIHLPSVYVDYILQGERYTHPMEHVKLRQPKKDNMDLKDKIAKRATQEIKEGMNVNLGIGIPTLCANFLAEDFDVTFQSENGYLGLGQYPQTLDDLDPDLINAGKIPVTVNPGASFFTSSESFAMIRGGHMDLTILGGLQVSQRGDLANWIIPSKMVKGMGGAMDLVAGVQRVIVTMEHTNKEATKFAPRCSLPITGTECVDMCITDKAVFTWDKQTREMMLIEIAQGFSLEQLKAITPCVYTVSPSLKEF